MKIKLLSDGHYCGMDSLEFPIIVNGDKYFDGAKVSGAELIKVGADSANFNVNGFYFFIPGECEVIE